MEIIPAILPQSYRAIEGGVEKVKDAVNKVQIDFVDGVFAANKTWWFNGNDPEKLAALLNEEEGLPSWETMNYEFDLMVTDPLKDIDTFTMLGPSKIIFHIEGLDTDKMLAYFETLPGIVKETIDFGMAIGIDTDPLLIAPFKDHITTIQCMGIARVGFQGQAFDERVIDQIKKVKALYPDKMVIVDGGVTLENAPILSEAGAEGLVVGSLIFQNPDPTSIIRRLISLCQSQPTP